MKAIGLGIGAISLWILGKAAATTIEQSIAAGEPYTAAATAHVVLVGCAVILAYYAITPRIAKMAQRRG